MTINIPYDYTSNTCYHRLPCGICRITMMQCPKGGVEIKPVTVSTGISSGVIYTDHTKVKLDKE